MEKKIDSLDFYVDEKPDDINSVKLFNQEWSSKFPGNLSGITGNSPLFEDPRVKYWIEKIQKSFPYSLHNPEKFKILELGPLEAGHTYMLSRVGWNVTSIESNSRAFLKCLIAANIFNIKAKFLLGNFEQHFEKEYSENKYDFILASGVLYHLEKPTEILGKILKSCKSIGIWTHFITPEYISQQPTRWTSHKYWDELKGEDVEGYIQFYNDALKNSSFCGGGQDYSVWLSKEKIINVLVENGFSFEIETIDESNSNGPNMTLFAQRV